MFRRAFSPLTCLLPVRAAVAWRLSLCVSSVCVFLPTLPTLPTLLTLSKAHAAELPLPPRAEWRASSSTPDVTGSAAKLAIDGDVTTRWGAAVSSETWLQLDLGKAASVGGVVLHWETSFGHRHSDFAASYRVLASNDGRAWQTVFETSDGQGGLEHVFFPSVQARYLRLVSRPLSADWGLALFELEPLAAADAPRLEGLAAGADPAGVWAGNAGAPRVLSSAHTLTITLPRPIATSGLEVDWGTGLREVQLEGREADGAFRVLGADKTPAAEHSLLAASKPITASALRLTVRAQPQSEPAIRRLRLLPPDRLRTPLRRYEVAASGAQRPLFPLNLRNQQVYWTSVGIAGAPQKSIFDEFGNLEAWKGAPLLQPLWRDATGHVHAAHGGSPKQALRDGWLPMPSAEWKPTSGLTVRSEAFALEQAGQPVTLLRHRLQNTDKRRIDGELILLLRPSQIAPPWQYAGFSPIHDIAFEGDAGDTGVRVNGRLFLRSLTPAQARGAAGFGVHGEGELTRAVAAGVLPTSIQAHDYDGLAAGYLRYAVSLAPGETRDVVLAFPLGAKKIDMLEGKLPEAAALDIAGLVGANKDAGARFDVLAEQVAKTWRERTSQVGIELPDHDLTNMVRAQLAYILINQTGPAIQPGPRNYNRSFIRDGSMTAAVLMQMGLPKPAREYLRWFAEHAVHENGLVSPILGEDGKVDRGFGSDLEYDSQGEFISLVADVARLDGGAETVRDYLPKVRLAMRFIEQLRARTLVPDYQHTLEAPERFRGILAPSISHEGYSVPTHSYWDDYWALKGLHDGARLAAALGDAELAAYARAQYAALHGSVAASIRATMAWKHIAFVPSSADLGDPDATGTSIALDPCGVVDVLPEAAVKYTFDEYTQKVRKRAVSRDTWDFTPYELRNVLSYVRLNRPKEANELLTELLRYRRPLAWQMFAEVVHSRLRHAGYFGDMPHTWIGTELVRVVIGMLTHEGDAALELLPGAPPAWLAGDGVRLSELHTTYGRLSMTARQEGARLRVGLGPGLAPNTALQVSWPARKKPKQVWVDGQPRTNQTADGIAVEKPFKELVAEW
ncbi:MAG: discoidin domain-containing protein [Polyangiales bacterium]